MCVNACSSDEFINNCKDNVIGGGLLLIKFWDIHVWSKRFVLIEIDIKRTSKIMSIFYKPISRMDILGFISNMHLYYIHTLCQHVLLAAHVVGSNRT